MKVLRWLVPLVSLLVVLAVTLWDVGGERMGPGPLHPAHAKLAELRGGRCEACHRAGEGVDAAACGSCHQAIATQLAENRGLHGTLAAGVRERCGVCHSDHHGDTAPLLAPHAFPLAGYPKKEAFDHRQVDWKLHGAHTDLACSKCHLAADERDPPQGGRFLGLRQTCTECHEDVHHTKFGSDCEKCHGQDGPWKATPGFRHETFALRDSHRRVECASCHPLDSPFAVAALQAAPPKDPRSCVVCHVDPHAADTAMRFENTADCARCHDATQWKAARSTADAHAAYGFPLHGQHATIECAACHGDAKTPRSWLGAAPKVEACAACHEHPHRRELVASATAGIGPANGCAGCHHDADPDWKSGTMDAAQHATTGFALVAPHADVACAKCHAGTTREARFPGRDAANCRSCHDDVHRGQFDHEPRYAQCTACHLPTKFHPSEFGVAAHGKTTFPLTGAHDAVACSGCHTKVDAGVRTFHGTSADCASCHTDVHHGAFDRAGRPKTTKSGSGCARCHDTNAFAPVASSFDHGQWTGWPLAGAHASVDCTKCHPRSTAPDAKAMRLGRATGTTCASCHTDPHAGQFARGGSTDCAACHRETTFRIERFDHGKTRFPLDATHAEVACAKCHAAYPTAQGSVTRYKPLGVTCGDCHALGEKGGRK